VVSYRIENLAGARIISFPRRDLFDVDKVRTYEEELIDEMREDRYRNYCIDLDGISNVCSQALGMFISLHRELRASDRGELSFVNVSHEVYDVFTTTNLHKMFNIYCDIHEFLATQEQAAEDE